jgi:hypothetical protein
MAAKEDLLKDLAQQKEFREKSAKEWVADWKKSLKALFAQFAAWLAEAKANKLLTVEEGQTRILEPKLGFYIAPTIRVVTPGGEVVEIAPKGRVIVGGYGRVDLECSPKRAMVVQRTPGRWEFAELTPERGGWSFKGLTEESFWETLRYLLS